MFLDFAISFQNAYYDKVDVVTLALYGNNSWGILDVYSNPNFAWIEKPFNFHIIFLSKNKLDQKKLVDARKKWTLPDFPGHMRQEKLSTKFAQTGTANTWCIFGQSFLIHFPNTVKPTVSNNNSFYSFPQTLFTGVTNLGNKY